MGIVIEVLLSCALCLAAHTFNLDTYDQPLLNAAMHFFSGMLGQRPCHWNDMPGRTPEEILDAFDTAIALAGAKEFSELPRSVLVAAGIVEGPEDVLVTV